MGWAKGQTGNAAGRPKGNATLAAEIRKLAEGSAVDTDGKKRKRKILLARLLWQKALDGDFKSQELLIAYSDGKPRQQVEHEGGVALDVRISYVDPGTSEPSVPDAGNESK